MSGPSSSSVPAGSLQSSLAGITTTSSSPSSLSSSGGRPFYLNSSHFSTPAFSSTSGTPPLSPLEQTPRVRPGMILKTEIAAAAAAAAAASAVEGQGGTRHISEGKSSIQQRLTAVTGAITAAAAAGSVAQREGDAAEEEGPTLFFRAGGGRFGLVDDLTPVNGYLLLAATFFYFVISLYAMVFSKFMPYTGNKVPSPLSPRIGWKIEFCGFFSFAAAMCARFWIS